MTPGSRIIADGKGHTSGSSGGVEDSVQPVRSRGSEPWFRIVMISGVSLRLSLPTGSTKTLSMTSCDVAGTAMSTNAIIAPHMVPPPSVNSVPSASKYAAHGCGAKTAPQLAADRPCLGTFAGQAADRSARMATMRRSRTDPQSVGPAASPLAGLLM